MKRAMPELNNLTLCAAAALLRQGEITPAELDLALREAIAARNTEMNAYSWLVELRSDNHSELGLGYALKANIASRGQPTDCSSRILADYRPPYDATVVQRLHAAGMNIVGKTNMDEFAMGSSSEHSCHGTSRNPWDLDRTPGGSSGGSAAAVAADLAFFALGSDTGGSVRQPAHCCGIVGLKPTYGRISRYGLVAFASSLDQIGPLCKDVRDAAWVYSMLAGHDPRDATSLQEPVGDPVAAVDKPVRGLRVGVPWHILQEGLQPDVLSDFRSALDDLAAEGVELVEVTLPSLPFAIATYYVVCTAEASSNLARYDGIRYGFRAAAEGRTDAVAATRTAGFGPEVKRRILLGTYVLSAGYYDAYYCKAQQVRTKIAEDFHQAFITCDAVALPTAPTAAFRLGERIADPLQMYLSDIFTVPANLTGMPAITVPTGLDRVAMPLSIQLLAPALQEERLFTLAGAVERARDFRARPEAPWNR
jgi:aspartyl-tRNA(Asn)/glutamyl-tRNA(Gln) amidotransferase subunit A